jgi:UDP-GlcNAc3NAcA epimerase
MIEPIERVLVDIRPDWVVVYGDTDTTLAGALAAAKLHQPVAHVEAGLRSFNRRMPEEINRVLTDHVSELLFAPSATAVANLQREGLPAERIREVGDVMYDAVLLFADAARTRAGLLTSLRLEPRRYVLATVHRAENTDDRSRLEAILGSLDAVASSGTPVVVPLHPRTRAAIRRWALDGLCRRLVVLDPIGYLEMLVLEQHAAVIATDSGGVQKEAYFFRVPCVTLRDETEWVELVDTGWNRLASPDLSPREIATRILAAIGRRGREGELYGEGRAASQIALTIAKTAP